MKVFYIPLNICFPYHNDVIPINTKKNGFTYTFYSTVPISPTINLVCGSMSKCCILDISSSSVGIASTFSCSWIPFGSFFSQPLLLRSCGISGCTSSSWATPLLRSYDSSVYTSSSWAIPLSLAFVSSSWLDTYVLVGLPQMKSGKFFW